jgi:hypothetical protein
MIDGDLFDKLEEIARTIKRSEKPFGGIQVNKLSVNHPVPCSLSFQDARLRTEFLLFNF